MGFLHWRVFVKLLSHSDFFIGESLWSYWSIQISPWESLCEVTETFRFLHWRVSVKLLSNSDFFIGESLWSYWAIQISSLESLCEATEQFRFLHWRVSVKLLSHSDFFIGESEKLLSHSDFFMGESHITSLGQNPLLCHWALGNQVTPLERLCDITEPIRRPH